MKRATPSVRFDKINHVLLGTVRSEGKRVKSTKIPSDFVGYSRL